MSFKCVILFSALMAILFSGAILKRHFGEHLCESILNLGQT